MMRALKAGGAIAVVVMLAACGGESLSEKAVEELTGVEVDQDGNVVSISTAEGAMEVDGDGNIKVVTSDGEQVLSGAGEGEVPTDFPGDIPLPDLPILNSLSSSTDGQQTWIINFSADDAKSAYEAYTAELESAGYTLEEGFVGESGGVFSAMTGSTNGTWEVGVLAADGSLSITVESANP